MLGMLSVAGAGVYLFFQVRIAGILVFLTGLLSAAYFLLLAPRYVTFSQHGIAQRGLLRGWAFDWSAISRWNLILPGQGKKAVWFIVGAKLYKINPEFFWKNDVDVLTAYFEAFCGPQADGANRLDASFTNFLR
jgi:hypothetical protein